MLSKKKNVSTKNLPISVLKPVYHCHLFVNHQIQTRPPLCVNKMLF